MVRPTREMRTRPILSLGLGGTILGGTGGPTDPLEQYVLVTEGGRDTVFDHGNLGSTEDIDPTDGNVHAGTLDADSTITLLAPDTTRASSVTTIELYLTEDGTGGWTPTFAASGGTIVWPGGSAPDHDTDADSLTRYIFETLDDGVTWYGLQVGGGGGSVAIDDGSTTVDPATDITFIGAGVATVAVTDDTGGAATVAITVPTPNTHGALLLASDHPTPFDFEDILQASDGSDFLYASE